jgi:hypothetical protein
MARNLAPNNVFDLTDVMAMTVSVGASGFARTVNIEIGPLSVLLAQFNTTVTTTSGTVALVSTTADNWITVTVDSLPANTRANLTFFVTAASSGSGSDLATYLCGTMVDVYYPHVSVSSQTSTSTYELDRARVASGNFVTFNNTCSGRTGRSTTEKSAALLSQAAVVTSARSASTTLDNADLRSAAASTPADMLTAIAFTGAYEHSLGNTWPADAAATTALKNFIVAAELFDVATYPCPVIQSFYVYRSAGAVSRTTFETAASAALVAQNTAFNMWVGGLVGTANTASVATIVGYHYGMAIMLVNNCSP